MNIDIHAFEHINTISLYQYYWDWLNFLWSSGQESIRSFFYSIVIPDFIVGDWHAISVGQKKNNQNFVSKGLAWSYKNNVWKKQFWFKILFPKPTLCTAKWNYWAFLGRNQTCPRWHRNWTVWRFELWQALDQKHICTLGVPICLIKTGGLLFAVGISF